MFPPEIRDRSLVCGGRGEEGRVRREKEEIVRRGALHEIHQGGEGQKGQSTDEAELEAGRTEKPTEAGNGRRAWWGLGVILGVVIGVEEEEEREGVEDRVDLEVNSKTKHGGGKREASLQDEVKGGGDKEAQEGLGVSSGGYRQDEGIEEPER